jgi:dienelactone hydrolase
MSEPSNGTPPPSLAGTSALDLEGDLAMEMESGMARYFLRRTQQAPQERSLLWHWDFSSAENYESSVAGHRHNLRRIVGALDDRTAGSTPEVLASPLESVELARGSGYRVFAIRWQVIDPSDLGFSGLHAEGLLLEPEGDAAARVVALPDADWTPEMLAGLTDGVPASAQFARRLAENGCQVVVPLLIDRRDTFSGNPEIQMTNEPHREWIYRMAFQLGRHIIGYEVQKVLAVIDWFSSENRGRPVPSGVMGYGEGGLIAFYAAALDTRIDATVVSAYFQERENAWQEPIYRDVWGLLREFGDAEIASLIAPRPLIVEACHGPEVEGPSPPVPPRRNAACPSGRLITPPLSSVLREMNRTRPIFAGLRAEENLKLVVNDEGHGLPGAEHTLRLLLQSLGISTFRPDDGGRKGQILLRAVNNQSRLQSQVENMVAFTQGLSERSAQQRAAFWSGADSSSPERWFETTRSRRDYIWEEIFGRLPSPNLPPNPRTRLIYDTPRFVGYEVVLDVWPEVFSYGILLVPKDLGHGERRPAVVCQHGFEGRPRDVADPRINSEFYHHFGATLADLGFVVYAPQNPCFGGEHFRTPQRLGHPLKAGLHSLILGQNEQLLRWLGQQPFVDPRRIAFYGMSYGGKSAIRVPPMLEGYALSICSGDFNDAVWSMTGVDSTGFMFDDSYDLFEFNFANVVGYAELANLMAPRPFMVERGHRDGTSVDERVAFEYAKVERFYDHLGLDQQTAIEYFDGGHTIHGKATFEFLCKHLHFEPPARG